MRSVLDMWIHNEILSKCKIYNIYILHKYTFLLKFSWKKDSFYFCLVK